MDPVPQPSRRRRSLTHPSTHTEDLVHGITSERVRDPLRVPVNRSDRSSQETTLDSIKDHIQKMIHSNRHGGLTSHYHHGNTWEFFRDHIHKLGHKSDISSHHDSHEKTFDLLKDQFHKLTHRHGEPGDSTCSHESAWEFLKEHVQKIAHKGSSLSPQSSDEIDAPRYSLGEMASKPLKRASSDHGQDSPLDFRRDRILKLTNHHDSLDISHSHENRSEFRKDGLYRLTHRSLTETHLSSDPLGAAVMPYHGSYGSLIRTRKSAPMSPIIEGLDLDFPDYSRDSHDYYRDSEYAYLRTYLLDKKLFP